MKSKISLIIILVLLILSIIGTIFVTTLFLKSERTVKELNAKIDELTQTTNSTESTEDEKEKIESDKVEIPDTNIIVDENGIGKVPEGQIGYRKLTEDGMMLFRPDSEKYFYYNADGTEYRCSADVEKDGSVYVTFKNSKVDIKNVEITGFSGKPVSAHVTWFGQGVGDNTYHILVLMEDGSVEYIRANDLTDGKYISSGKIEPFNNVIRIEDGSVGHKQGGGYHGAALVTEDGSVYVISNI